MAVSSHRNQSEGTQRTSSASPYAPFMGPDALEEKPPVRDWKKLSLVIGLGVLSWVATYVGMLELIEANMGELPLVHKVITAFSVAMLMTMIVWLLDQLFAPIGLFTKTVYALGYVFLTIISVGFGFGFYWKVLESKSEATRGAESAITQVQSALHGASTRLEQLQSTLVQLTALSTQKAELERTQGTSCPNSKPGDGPRRKLREDDAQRFTFASDFVKGRAAQVKTEIAALDAELAKIVAGDASTVDAKSGTRNEFMKGVGRKLDLTVTGFNAFRTDPQLKQLRADLAERADKTTFLDTRGQTYSCPDPQLSGALKGVVRAIDALPDVDKPKIVAVEGSEATIEAFRRLTATFAGVLTFKLPPSADELRDLQAKTIRSVDGQATAGSTAVTPGGHKSTEQPGLSKRDYVPLAVAIFVDLCLLLVSMGRPANRLGTLVPKMRAAQAGPVSGLLHAFRTMHDDPAVREDFEVFRHIVFDFNGDYYAAVPMIAPYRRNNRGERVSYSTQDIENLTQEAHLLSNLFTSFEKEKIFTRVYNPLLTTSQIQKRLWRQGSKFAHAESFRLYKFKDGAWSEFILSAVMGAAKRVEAEKRRQAVDDGILTSTGQPAPDLAPPPSMQRGEPRTVRPDAGSPLDPAMIAAAHSVVYGAAAGQPPVSATDAPSPGNGWPVQWPAAAQALPQAAQDWTQTGFVPTPGPFTGVVPPDRIFDDLPNVEPHPARARGAQRLQEMTQRVGYGPHGAGTPGFDAHNNNTHPEARAEARYAERAVVNGVPYGPARGLASASETGAATGLPFGGAVSVTPMAYDAGHGSASAGRPPLGADLAPPPSTAVSDPIAQFLMPRAAPTAAALPERTIAVEARRETVTYHVPISEASLPHSLWAALDRAGHSVDSPPVIASAPGDSGAARLAPLVLEAASPALQIDRSSDIAPALPLHVASVVDAAAAEAMAAIDPPGTEADVHILPFDTDELDEATKRLVGKLGPRSS